MDVLALTQAIYWLLGVSAFLCVLVIAWKLCENKFWFWAAQPTLVTVLGCSYIIAAPAHLLICSAIAVLCGMLMYASGCAFALCILVAFLIAILLPILMILAVMALMFILLVIGIALYYLCIWIYFGIQGEVKKAKERRAKRKKAKKAKAQESKTE